MEKNSLHTDTAISCNSIKKKKKEEEIVPFERISCLSPQLAMRLAEATEQFGGYAVGTAIELSLDEVYQTGNEQFMCKHGVFPDECEVCEQ